MSKFQSAFRERWERVCSSASLPTFTRVFYEWAQGQGIKHDTLRCEISTLDKALKWAGQYVSWAYSANTREERDFNLVKDAVPEVCFPLSTDRLFGMDKSLILAVRANDLLKSRRTSPLGAMATGLWFEAVQAQLVIADPCADILKSLAVKYQLILFENSLGLGTERMQHLTEFFTLFNILIEHSIRVPEWLHKYVSYCQSLVNAIQDTVNFDTSALFDESCYCQLDGRWTVHDAIDCGQLKGPDELGILKVQNLLQDEAGMNDLSAIKTYLNAILFWLYMCSINNNIDPKFEFWKIRFSRIIQTISTMPEHSRPEVDVELVWKVYFHVSRTTFVSPSFRGIWLSSNGLFQLAGRPSVTNPAPFAFAEYLSKADIVRSYGGAQIFKEAVIQMMSLRSRREWAMMTDIEQTAATFNASGKNYALALFYNRGLEVSEHSGFPRHRTIEWLRGGYWDWIIWKDAEFVSALENGTLDDVYNQNQITGSQLVDNFYHFDPQSAGPWDGASTPSTDFLTSSVDLKPSELG